MSNRTNFLPPDLDPLDQSDLWARRTFGGNSRAVDYKSRYSMVNDNSTLQDRIEGRASAAPNRSYRYNNKSRSYRFGGGNTSNDPGAGNWVTYERNLNRAVDIGKGLVNYRMENKRNAKAKASAKANAVDLQNEMDSFEDPLLPPAMRNAPAMPSNNTPRNSRRPTKSSPFSGPQPPAPAPF